MICPKCGAEMPLQSKLDLNFTSPRFEKNGDFKVPAVSRTAETYFCSECGITQYTAISPEEKE